jgi:hypothetical protein
MYEDEDNDGRYPDESPVEVRYPSSKQEEQADRGTWPWLPGSIVDRWIEAMELCKAMVGHDPQSNTWQAARRCQLAPAAMEGTAPLLAPLADP